MAEFDPLHEEARDELRAYADATSVTPDELERALVRTLARARIGRAV